MATRQYIRTYFSVTLQRRVCTSSAREGIARSNVSGEVYFQSQIVSIRFALEYPSIQIHVDVYDICAKKQLEPPSGKRG
jgi:hypothetical protein